MKDFEEIISKIARENGTTPENVHREMQLAMNYAYNRHNNEAQPFLDMISSKGNMTIPEEFIFALAMMLDHGSGLTN